MGPHCGPSLLDVWRVARMTSTTVGQPAFDMPGGETCGQRKARVIDFAQLRRQTMDDRDLEREVLSLFVHEATGISERIAAAPPAERARMAHGLKGSSRSVGAFPIADCAEELERAPDQTAIIQQLRRRVAEMAEFVASISR